jgi:hypothetical protein
MRIAGLGPTSALTALSFLLPQASLPAQAAEAGAVTGTISPWAVESPGAAGAPFGIGIDFASERSTGLRITSADSVVTLRDLARGTTETTSLPGDPSLLNRKFAIRVRSTGEGAQVPIALPRLRLGGVSLFPTLILQAASTRVAVDFADLPQPTDSTALGGRAFLYEPGLALAARLCSDCPWFAAAGYRLGILRHLSAWRSPGFAAPGFTVLEDRSRLGLRQDEALLRIGRSLPGGRVAVYLGLVWGRDQLVDDDAVRLRSDQAEETDLSSRTRLAVSATAGLVGIEARITGPLLLRLEGVVGGGRSGVALKLAYLRMPAPRPPQKPPRRYERSQQEVARQILARLGRVEEALAAEPRAPRGARPGEPEMVPAAAVAHWLDDVERQFLAALAGEELIALRDYVRDLFQRARQDLGLAAARTVAESGGRPRGLLAQASLTSRPRPAGAAVLPRQDQEVSRRKLDTWHCRFDDLKENFRRWAQHLRLQIDLQVKSEPEDGRQFGIEPYSYPPGHQDLRTNGTLEGVWRGLYRYTVDGGESYQEAAGDRLDLVRGSPLIVLCHLAPISDAEDTTSCDPQSEEAERACPP